MKLRHVKRNCFFLLLSIFVTTNVLIPITYADNQEQKEEKIMTETAYLAGGCFWGVQELIRKLPGVIHSEVGYTGGDVPNANYKLVSLGTTGHAESIKVEFDPTKLTYADLLRYYFRLHDPTTTNRQGNDRGTQYRSAIFYLNEEQKQAAEKIKDEVSKSGKWKDPVVTQVVPAKQFYSAEDSHQDYLQKNPGGYTCHFLRD